MRPILQKFFTTGPAAIALVIAAASALLRLTDVPNTDVTWLLACAQWWLDGKRIGVDILETNPPGSVLIYIPGALAGKFSGLDAHSINIALTVLCAAALSVWSATRIARALDRPHLAGMMTAGFAIILLVSPYNNLAQREHIGVLALLVWLTLAATPAQPASVAMKLLAGAGLTIAAMAKPHLLLVPALVQIATMAATRSWAGLFSAQNISGAVGVSAYAVSVPVLFPEYFSEVLPRVVDTYLPVRIPLLAIMIRPAFLLALAMTGLALIAAMRGGAASAGRVFLIAALGACLADIAQAKGFNYHALPFFALAGLAAVINMTASWRPPQPAPRISMFLFALLSAFAVGAFTAPLRPQIAAVAVELSRLKTPPRVLALGGNLTTSYPAVHMTKATWVQRPPFLYLAIGAERQRRTGVTPQRSEALARYDELERRMLAQDIRQGRPDVILLQLTPEIDWLAWARRDSELASLLEAFAPGPKAGGVLLLIRRDGK